MSAAKRTRQGQQSSSGKANTAISNHDSSIPASKRFKTSHDAEPQTTGLGSLLSTDSSRPKLTAKLTNGVSQKAASKVDESRAVVASGLDDSDPSLPEQDYELDTGELAEEEDTKAIVNGVNGTAHARGERRTNDDNDIAMADRADESDEELSFGDILKARHPDIIDVTAQLTNPEQARTLPNSIQLVAGHSLATVLQQALKTNDKDLLESCFQLRDVVAIKNTIQRLPSPLVGQLLARISERMYRRPGRAGALMIWIQWALVAHGGYLASQPEILHKLKALHQVIRQRAQGLQPLLQLKGKLDMLNAQLELRRETQITQRTRTVDVNDEAGVVYVEGDAENGWDDDADDDDSLNNSNVKQINAAPKSIDVDASEDELDDFNPVLQNESQDEEEDEVDEVDAADASILDIEAEESDGLEENSQDAEDDEDEDEDDEQDSEAESASVLEGDDDEDDDDHSSQTSYNDDPSFPGQRGRHN